MTPPIRLKRAYRTETEGSIAAVTWAGLMQTAFAVSAIGIFALTGCGQQAATIAPDDTVEEQPSGNDSTPNPNEADPVDASDPGPVKPGPNPDIPTASLYRGSSDLAPFVEKFVSDGLLQNVNVISNMESGPVEIRIASLDDYGQNVIGLCDTTSTGRTVTFDPDFWNTQNDVQREVLAHHELGHCVLFRDHRPGNLESGGYLSIMNPIIMSPSMYQSNYDYYQHELYTQQAEEGEEDLSQLRIEPTHRTFICDTTEL